MVKNIAKQKAIKTGNIKRRHQRSRKEESEFGKAGKEFILCPDCGSIFFDKAWHTGWRDEKSEHIKKDRQIKFKLCPACKMKKDRVFEGEIVIKFGNRGTNAKGDILNTIKNSDEQARERDPMDRILWMENRRDGLHIFTSENQLAVKIGKKLKSSFGGGKMEVKHSGEDIIRVYVEI